eukprot:TRINITY_DN1529_c0_g3_i1.p1 TRINITY_DN1529_c0_g3~~TRINITY_DN1529_c0_g3_i1.p1  ORF type:complete len:1901 (+),score=486.16 TRINITY_DN1529_c0_g3_i1:555-5705(+)
MHVIQVTNLESKAAALQRQLQKALTNDARMIPKRGVVEMESRHRDALMRAESAENEIKRLSEELGKATELLHSMQDDANSDRIANANLVSQTRLDIRKELEQAHLDIVEDQRQEFEDEVTARELANKRQIDSLVAELESLKREFVAVENECESYKREYKDVTEDLKKHKAELSIAGVTDAQSVEELKGQNERSQLMVNDLKLMNKRLQGREGALEARIVELELAAGLAQEEAAGEERMKAAAELSRIQEKHRDQSKKDAEELGRLRGLLSASETKLELNEELGASLEMKLDIAQRNSVELEAANAAISNQVDMREMEITHAENKIMQLEKNLAENRALLGRQAGQLQASQDRSAGLEGRLKELEERSDLSERGYASITAESSEARVTIELQAAEIQKARVASDQSEARVEELNKKIQEQRIELEQTIGYLESCRAKLQQSDDRSLGLEAALAQQASTLRAQLQVDCESGYTLKLNRERTEWEATSMELEQHLQIACQRRIWQASAAADAMRSAEALKSIAKSYALLQLFSNNRKLKAAVVDNQRLRDELDAATRRELAFQEELDVLQCEMKADAVKREDVLMRAGREQLKQLACQGLCLTAKNTELFLTTCYLSKWTKWCLVRRSQRTAVSVKQQVDEHSAAAKQTMSRAMTLHSTRLTMSTTYHAWLRWACLKLLNIEVTRQGDLKKSAEKADAETSAKMGELEKSLEQQVGSYNKLVSLHNDTQTKNKELESDVKKFKTLLEELHDINLQHANELNKNAALELRNQDLQDSLELADEECVRLRAYAEAKEEGLTGEEAKELEDEVKKLKASLTVTTGKINGLTTQRNNLLTKSETLQEQLVDAESRAQAREEELKVVDSYSGDLAERNEKIALLEKDASQATGEIRGLKSEVSRGVTEQGRLREDLHQAKRDLQEERIAHMSLKQTIDAMHTYEEEAREQASQVVTLRALLSAADEEKDVMMSEIQRIETECATYKGELEGLRIVRDKTESMADFPGGHVVAQTQDDSVNRAEVEALQEELEQTQLQVEVNNKKYEEARQKANNVVNDLTEQFLNITEEVGEFRNSYETMYQEAIILHQNLMTEFSEQKSRLEDENELLKDRCREDEDRICELQQELKMVPQPTSPLTSPPTSPPAAEKSESVKTMPLSPVLSGAGSVEPPLPSSPLVEPTESAPLSSPPSPFGRSKARRAAQQQRTSLSMDEAEKLKWIFEYGDVDRDGYLNYSELRQLAVDTSGELDEAQYKEILQAFGASDNGLTIDHLEKLYLGSDGDVSYNYESLQRLQEIQQTAPVEPPTIPEVESETQVESPRAVSIEEVAEERSVLIQSPPPPQREATRVEAQETRVEVKEETRVEETRVEVKAETAPEPEVVLEPEPVPVAEPVPVVPVAEPVPEQEPEPVPVQEVKPSDEAEKVPILAPAPITVPASSSPPIDESVPQPQAESPKHDEVETEVSCARSSRSGSLGSPVSLVSRSSSRKITGHPYGKYGSLSFKIAPPSRGEEVPVRVASSQKGIPKGALIIEVVNQTTGEVTKIATRENFQHAVSPSSKVFDGTKLTFKIVKDAEFIKKWEATHRLEYSKPKSKRSIKRKLIFPTATKGVEECVVTMQPMGVAQREVLLKKVQDKLSKGKKAGKAEKILTLQIDPESLKEVVRKETQMSEIHGSEGLGAILAALQRVCGFTAPPAKDAGPVSEYDGFTELWILARGCYLYAFDE